MKNFSVLILTHNEEINIIDCITSVDRSNDIVILDSFSTDRTKEYANLLNVRFYERKFTNYSEQRNYGMHNLVYKNDHLLILDADERASKELVEEILTCCNSTKFELYNVYLVRRKVFLEGKILRWNISSTIWIERLVRPHMVSYSGNVHEKLNYQGKHGLLKEYIIHKQFSKGIDNWIQRRKIYAELEAAKTVDAENGQPISTPQIVRRLRVRNFFIDYVPFFYLLYFAYNIFIHFAFLDGIKGIKYISLETYSLYLLHKLKRNDKQH